MRLPIRRSWIAKAMEIAEPFWFFLLPLPVLWGVWYFWKGRRRGGLRFSNSNAAFSVSRGLRPYLADLPVLLRTAAMILGIIALARPQVKDTTEEQFAEGIDIMLVLDTSTSMLAEDFRPNRFEAAREVAAEFVDNRLSDRIGLVVFAGKSYTQTPLTLDYNFLTSMLEEVRVGAIEDGTAIGTALATAISRLKDTEVESKVIILLTDGQNNRGEIDPVTAADISAALDVRIYTIGVGTRGEAPYPVSGVFGSSRQMIPVEIDEDMLTSVATKTGGQYFRATNERALREIYEQIGELETSRVETVVYTDYEERYLRYLWPALLLVMLEVILSTTLLRRFP